MCAAIGSMCMAIALGPVLINLREVSLEHPNVLLFAKFMPRCRATYDMLDIAGCVIDMAAKLNLAPVDAAGEGTISAPERTFGEPLEPDNSREELVLD